MPTMGASSEFGRPEPAGVEAEPGDGAVEAGVAEGEDAAVGGHEPVPALVLVGVMPTTGRWSRRLPVEPWKVAEPKVKMPPSDPTSQ